MHVQHQYIVVRKQESGISHPHRITCNIDICMYHPFHSPSKFEGNTYPTRPSANLLGNWHPKTCTHRKLSHVQYIQPCGQHMQEDSLQYYFWSILSFVQEQVQENFHCLMPHHSHQFMDKIWDLMGLQGPRKQPNDKIAHHSWDTIWGLCRRIEIFVKADASQVPYTQEKIISILFH